jgi:hypothetical protein
MGAGLPPRVPDYRLRILDVNHLAATEHRRKELRDLRAGPLPGQAVVVYDPQGALITAVLPGEDGHTQERALLADVLPLVQARDLWIADRNFCTTAFLFGIRARPSFFVIRPHAQALPWRLVGKRRDCGRSETGEVSEQTAELRDEEGNLLIARRKTVALDKPTRDGDREIHILTNLPAEEAAALTIAELYRGRWTSATALGELAETLSCEINTLAYPKVALCCFCVGLVAYNVLGVIKGALRAVHGEETVPKDVSGYYLANEVSRTYTGMMIAIEEKSWCVFGSMRVSEVSRVLKGLAQGVRLERLQKHPRGPKKPVTKKPKNKKQPHVSTARMLEKRKKTA